MKDAQAAGHDDEGKNPNRQAGGLKAAIHNPNVSEEAKENAKERLENEFGQKVDQ